MGLNWLRAVNADGKFGKGICQMGHKILKQVGCRLMQLHQKEPVGDEAGQGIVTRAAMDPGNLRRRMRQQLKS